MHESHSNESMIQTEIPSRNYVNCKKHIQLTLYLWLFQSKGLQVTCAQITPVLLGYPPVRSYLFFPLLKLKKH